jgi:nitrogen regulatory protein PII-like uncharacterized protein
MQSAQGTIEYLVIVGVVVVISLMVVSLVVNQSENAAGVSSSIDSIAAKTSVVGVSDAVVDVSGIGVVGFSNNSGSGITISKVSVDGVDTNFSPTYLANLDTRAFNIRDVGADCNCFGNVGSTRTCPIVVYGVSDTGLEKEFRSSVTVNCVLNTVLKENVISAQIQFSDVCVSNVPLWAKGAVNGSGTGYEDAKDVFVDSSGNVYAAGNFSSSVLDFGNSITLTHRGSTDFFVVKYNSSGVAQWARGVAAGTGYNGGEYANSVFVDSNGNVYVVGYFGSTTLGFDGNATNNLTKRAINDFFVVKYDSSGNVKWSRNPYTGTGNDLDNAYSVFVDSGGNVYVSGTFWSTTLGFKSGLTLTNRGGYDYFLVKYDSGGTAQWATNPASGTGTSYDFSLSLAVDSSNNVYLAGYSNSTTLGFGNSISLTNRGNNDFFVVKYNSSGVAQWARGAQASTGTSSENAYSVFVDSSSNIYVAGYFSSTILGFSSDVNLTNRGGSDFFVVKYNSSGVAQWAKNPYSAVASDQAFSVYGDTSGNVYVVGSFSSTLNLSSDISLTSNGSSDFFIAKYNSSGVIEWAKKPIIGAGLDDYSYSGVVDSNGNVYVSGYFTSNMIGFGNNVNLTNTGSGSYDFFVVKYSSSSEPVCSAGGVVGNYCSANNDCLSGMCDSYSRICSDGSLGSSCAAREDCVSGYCDTAHHVCTAGQTGVDGCFSRLECVSGYCDTYSYLCSDGALGSGCSSWEDCSSGYCDSYITNTCTDGSNGQGCSSGSDCQSGSCVYSYYDGRYLGQAYFCTDGALGSPCTSGSDCQSGYCETSGPTVCTTGEAGSLCGNPTDCQSGICSSYNYTCSDGVTGVDYCYNNPDCVSGYCDTLNYICSSGENGSFCSNGSDCISGSCVSSICE